MSKLGKRIDRAFNNLGEQRRVAQLTVGYRRKYSFVLKSKVLNPPEEVSAGSVNSVWKEYGNINPKWAQYYWSLNGIASPYYIPTDFYYGKVCRKLNSLDRFGWPLF